MPTVLREAGLRLHFFSADGHEPPHVHVDGRGCKAKVWLRDASIARSVGFSVIELGRISMLVTEHRTSLLEAWNDRFG